LGLGEERLNRPPRYAARGAYAANIRGVEGRNRARRDGIGCQANHVSGTASHKCPLLARHCGRTRRATAMGALGGVRRDQGRWHRLVRSDRRRRRAAAVDACAASRPAILILPFFRWAEFRNTTNATDRQQCPISVRGSPALQSHQLDHLASTRGANHDLLTTTYRVNASVCRRGAHIRSLQVSWPPNPHGSHDLRSCAVGMKSHITHLPELIITGHLIKDCSFHCIPVLSLPVRESLVVSLGTRHVDGLTGARLGTKAWRVSFRQRSIRRCCRMWRHRQQIKRQPAAGQVGTICARSRTLYTPWDITYGTGITANLPIPLTLQPPSQTCLRKQHIPVARRVSVSVVFMPKHELRWRTGAIPIIGVENGAFEAGLSAGYYPFLN